MAIVGNTLATQAELYAKSVRRKAYAFEKNPGKWRRQYRKLDGRGLAVRNVERYEAAGKAGREEVKRLREAGILPPKKKGLGYYLPELKLSSRKKVTLPQINFPPCIEP